MFDDLLDPQPSEPGDTGLPSDDELLSDLTSDEPVADPFGLDEPVGPLFGDEPRFGDEVIGGAAPGSGGERLILGMTAQQRAVLSVFLFLDVSALGCVLLLAAGAISIP